MATERPTTKQTLPRLAEVERRVDEAQLVVEAWWVKQTRRTQIGVALAALVSVVLVVNLFGAVSRTTASAPGQVAASSAPAASTGLALEFAPNDAGKAWTPNRAWQGSSTYRPLHGRRPLARRLALQPRPARRDPAGPHLFARWRAPAGRREFTYERCGHELLGGVGYVLPQGQLDRRRLEARRPGPALASGYFNPE